MYKKFLPHLPQFLRYLVSGGTAAALEIGSYQIMLWAWSEDWYFAAAMISGGIGLLVAFIGHKFFAFKKKQETRRQLFRYAILQATNYFAQLYMVYAFVEIAGLHPTLAKVLGIGITVSWNFFIYKFFVYV